MPVPPALGAAVSPVQLRISPEAAVPKFGATIVAPVTHTWFPEPEVPGKLDRSLYEPDVATVAKEGAPIRSLYAPVVATVANAPPIPAMDEANAESAVSTYVFVVA